jgi:hypothetical protein
MKLPAKHVQSSGSVMRAAEVLRAARAVDITVRSDGECLLLETNVESINAVLDALVRHKPAILNLLQPRAFGWRVNWRAYTKRREIVGSNKGRSPTEAKAKSTETQASARTKRSNIKSRQQEFVISEE